MTVAHIEVLVEEPSAEAALRILMPRMVGNIPFVIHPYTCKTEMLNRLPDRLRGYAKWIPDDRRIVVLVDRDDDDCMKLKEHLELISAEAGLPTRSGRRRSRFIVVNRLAIEELEAWFFGDWEAVRQAYPRVNVHVPSKSGYRNPDTIQGGTWEAFERCLKNAGYFRTGLRKIEAARAVASHMDPARNASPSFRAFRDAMEEMAIR